MSLNFVRETLSGVLCNIFIFNIVNIEDKKYFETTKFNRTCAWALLLSYKLHFLCQSVCF